MHNEPGIDRKHLFRWHHANKALIAVSCEAGENSQTHARPAGIEQQSRRIYPKRYPRSGGMLRQPGAAAKIGHLIDPRDDLDLAKIHRAVSQLPGHYIVGRGIDCEIDRPDPPHQQVPLVRTDRPQRQVGVAATRRRPSRGAWIETIASSMAHVADSQVAPRAGRGSKHAQDRPDLRRDACRPSRGGVDRNFTYGSAMQPAVGSPLAQGRGSKLAQRDATCVTTRGRPSRGAWIETPNRRRAATASQRRPSRGAWIETTASSSGRASAGRSPLARGRGSKHATVHRRLQRADVAPRAGRGSKPSTATRHASGAAGRPSRGGVDRNSPCRQCRGAPGESPLARGVDRNHPKVVAATVLTSRPSHRAWIETTCTDNGTTNRRVAPLAQSSHRGVDRNIMVMFTTSRSTRPPLAQPPLRADLSQRHHQSGLRRRFFAPHRPSA